MHASRPEFPPTHNPSYGEIAAPARSYEVVLRKTGLLILPGLRDQRDNAMRVTARGAGLMLERDATPEKIAAAATRLLAEPAFAEAAKRLGAAIVEDMDRRSAETELEAMLRPA